MLLHGKKTDKNVRWRNVISSCSSSSYCDDSPTLCKFSSFVVGLLGSHQHRPNQTRKMLMVNNLHTMFLPHRVLQYPQGFLHQSAGGKVDWKCVLANENDRNKVNFVCNLRAILQQWLAKSPKVWPLLTLSVKSCTFWVLSPSVWPFKWMLLSSTFKWCCLFLTIL